MEHEIVGWVSMLDRVCGLLGAAECQQASVESRAAMRVARVAIETLCERMTEVEVREALAKPGGGRVVEAG